MSRFQRLNVNPAGATALPVLEPFQVAGPVRSGTTKTLPQAPGEQWSAGTGGDAQQRGAALAMSVVREWAKVHPVGALWAGIGSGMLIITMMWLATRVPAASFGAAMVNGGSLLGLYAGFLVVVLLALMARIPLLDKAIGAGHLSRVHGRIGGYVVLLVVAHGLLIWWGYAVSANASLPAQAVTLMLGYPYVGLATLGSVLLVAVGFYSARVVRRRVSYEAWYVLHLGTYLAIALAFGHQIVDGALFAALPVVRVWWIGLYAGVAILLLWYRFCVPLSNALRQRMVVTHVRQEAPGVVSVYFTGRDLASFAAEPGQFVRLRFLTKATWRQSHPFSLSAAPNPHWLRVTIKAVGDHTSVLQVLRPGTRVMASGGYGALTAARRTRPGAVLIAGGVGVTPLRALFESLSTTPGQLTLLYRTSTPDDVLFRQELDAIAAARGAQVHYLVGNRGDKVRADPLNPTDVRRLVPDIAERDAYVCGPAGMAKAASALLRSCGVPAERIHREDYAFAS
ncbi:ferredoxin reductase family protein [Actinopolymorpha sp. B17G11]|uniref:ferredoxin reductase family protein n=1 Tax=Actinopolymorpha sp. B17G11 TaxID=3160861 RepID=UPI0032E48449